MFARVKKSGKYQYLQLVENRKEKVWDHHPGPCVCSWRGAAQELDRCLGKPGSVGVGGDQTGSENNGAVTIGNPANVCRHSQCQGCGKVFQAVGVALPPTIREL
jgi:hypothetical protein